MKISREIKTAILVILGIILFIFGFSYLKGNNLLDDSRIIYAEYDNVDGLTPSTPVTINGYAVGKVLEIYFKDASSGVLVVKMDIDTAFEFSKNSQALLYQNGFIGGKAVAIIPAYDGGANAEDGDYLPGTVKAGMTEVLNDRLEPLQHKVEKVMSETDTLLVNFNSIFDKETKANLKASVANLNITITSFNKTTKALNEILESNKSKLSNTLTNAENMTENFSKFSDSLSQINLAGTIKSLQETVEKFDNVLASVERGDGSLGKLLKDEKMYDNLTGASKQMEELLQDMKLNPKRYVHFSLFGKKPKRYDAEGNEIEDSTEDPKD
ncbi:MlaD family protein [Lacinutrix sp. Hel_I_90]|uniref:MlaD family protein n=1 Tax=Lacinutrix sp. Hel_I_90 TaxID=1249999 RepID=UPI0005C91AC5|nr:MlaD family protein [Lacinutrix sp. Hel_I_90]